MNLLERFMARIITSRGHRHKSRRKQEIETADFYFLFFWAAVSFPVIGRLSYVCFFTAALKRANNLSFT